MRKVALRGMRARPLRTVLTAMSVVLGVAMIAGTYVLTDTINKSFSEVFSQANQGTDVVVVPGSVDEDFHTDPAPLDEALLRRVRALAADDRERVAELQPLVAKGLRRQRHLAGRARCAARR